MELPQPVKADQAEVLPLLAHAGLELFDCQYSPDVFGNYTVRFGGLTDLLEIRRNRGQYLLGGSRERLEGLGYWRALENAQELATGVQAYLTAAALRGSA